MKIINTVTHPIVCMFVSLSFRSQVQNAEQQLLHDKERKRIALDVFYNEQIRMVDEAVRDMRAVEEQVRFFDTHSRPWD